MAESSFIEGRSLFCVDSPAEVPDVAGLVVVVGASFMVVSGGGFLLPYATFLEAVKNAIVLA